MAKIIFTKHTLSQYPDEETLQKPILELKELKFWSKWWENEYPSGVFAGLIELNWFRGDPNGFAEIGELVGLQRWVSKWVNE